MRVVSHRTSFNPYPLLCLAALFAAGVGVAHFSAPHVHWALAWGALCSVSALIAFARRRLSSATLSLSAAFVCAGATLAFVEQQSVGAARLQRFYDDARIEAGAPVELTGVLERAPEVAPDGLYLALGVERVRYKTNDTQAAGAVELFAPTRDGAARAAYEALELRRGARVRVLVQLERAEEYRNPGASSLTEFLTRRGFDATGTLKSPLLIERLDDKRVLLPLVWLDVWREALRARFVNLFSAETAGVLQAALLGNRYGLSRDTAERFRAGGTFHVLVISGLHISFIGWLTFLLLRLVTKRRALQFAVTILLLWAYTVAVGANVSVVRAALMFTLIALAPLLGRRASSLNALGGAALALLIWRPSDLFDPSFQLTYASVLGIVALGWPMLERLQTVGAWRPTRATPHPPACPRWFRTLGEILYWRERAWQRELARTVYQYRLFKHPAAAPLERWHVQRPLRYACAAIVISASVQLALLPLLVIYFHRVTPAALVLNIFVGVLMATLALVALAATLLSSLSLKLAQPLVWLGERLNWLMTHSVDPFMRAHIAGLRLPAYHGWAATVYVLYYAALVVLLLALARWQPLAPTQTQKPTTTDEQPTSFIVHWRIRPRGLIFAGLACAALLCVIIAHPLSASPPDGRLRIDFLDVGQGDAALITFPDGTTLLIDGGGRPTFYGRKRPTRPARNAPGVASHDEQTPTDDDESAADSVQVAPMRTDKNGAPNADRADESANVDELESPPFKRDARSIGDAVVSEYLWWRGLDRVDYLLATHADVDHIDGLNDVTHNFAVRAVFVARTPARRPEYARLSATTKQARVPIYLLGRGAQLRFGAVTADVLWPPPDTNTDAPSGNDESIVLRLRFGARVFLFTGDIESRAESELLRAQEDLRCDVIKVGHHGSKTSSTEGFVRAAHPQLAVISVGRTSPFGHPDRAVVARWQANGAQVLVTGWRGTVTVSTDGRDLRVETYAHD